MPTFRPAVSAWLGCHHGIVNRSQLLALGVNRSAIAVLVQVGELIVVFEGVYRHAMWPDTFFSRCAAASAADPRLVVCCGSAGRLWKFRRTTTHKLHVTSTSTGISLGDGTLVHRCPIMPDEHVHERPDGIRVTSPARTMFDLSKHVTAINLESIIEQGLRRSQFDIPTLYDVGHLLCRQGRAGSQQFGQVLSSRPAWRRPVDSHPELALLHALSARGIHLRTQTKLVLRNGDIIHPDLVAAHHQQRSLSLRTG